MIIRDFEDIRAYRQSRIMDNIAIIGNKENWTKEQYRYALNRFISMERQDLRDGNVMLKNIIELYKSNIDKMFDKREAIKKIINHEEKLFNLYDIENFPQKGYAVYDKEKNCSEFSFMECIKLEDLKNKKFIFKTKSKLENILKCDFLPNTVCIPLINLKALDFINELCPNEFEYFDTIIEAKDGITSNYKLINILCSVKIADEKKSEYYYFNNNERFGYKKLVAKDDPLEGRNMVRDILNGYISSNIYVSPYFKYEYKKRKLKGVSFDDAEYPCEYMSSYEFYNPNTGIWEKW